MEGALKFSLLAGSYDAFLAFFGLAGLTEVSESFYGLPDYASTMAFELYSPETRTSFPEEKDLWVRFLFKNGTAGGLDSWPLFGTGRESLSWGEFTREMKGRAIGSAEEWCSACGSSDGFCATYTGVADEMFTRGGMPNAVAGVVGATVTLVVLGIVGLVAFLFVRRRRSGGSVVVMADEKGSVRSGSTGADKL